MVIIEEWILKRKKRIIFIGIFVLIGIPLIVYLLSAIPLIPSGGNNDWAGFWGGYIGAIIGGTVTLIGIYITLEDSKNKGKKDKIDEIKPYFVLDIDTVSSSGLGENIIVENLVGGNGISVDLYLSGRLKNVGLDSAVEVCGNDKLIFNAIQKSEAKDCCIRFKCGDLGRAKEKTELEIVISFKDLRENSYKQIFKFSFDDPYNIEQVRCYSQTSPK